MQKKFNPSAKPFIGKAENNENDYSPFSGVIKREVFKGQIAPPPLYEFPKRKDNSKAVPFQEDTSTTPTTVVATTDRGTQTVRATPLPYDGYCMLRVVLYELTRNKEDLIRPVTSLLDRARHMLIAPEYLHFARKNPPYRDVDDKLFSATLPCFRVKTGVIGHVWILSEIG